MFCKIENKYRFLLQLPVGYDISPLKRVKLKILTTSRELNLKF